MNEQGQGRLIKGSTERMRAATADLRRQFWIRNVVLMIVGIELCVFFILRAWNAS